jgi:uncharacterized cupin superfamily protein
MADEGGVVHQDQVEPMEMAHGRRFASRHRQLAAAAGAKRLRASLYEVEPGRTAYPFHAHHSVEEAMYILEGEGTLRLGEARIPVKAGCYAAFPAGGAAHQLLNTGSGTLRYLMMSASVVSADIVTYPDSNKVLVSAGDWDRREFSVRAIFPASATIGYWDGEDGG